MLLDVAMLTDTHVFPKVHAPHVLLDSVMHTNRHALPVVLLSALLGLTCSAQHTPAVYGRVLCNPTSMTPFS
jgi:hypothetical protein